MITIVPDISYDQEHLTLVTSVFIANNLNLDPTDYTIIKVTSVINPADLIKGNTIMELAPSVSNAQIDNLQLFYNRKDLTSTLTGLEAAFYKATVDDSLDEILNQIKISINNAVYLAMDDLFNTFVSVDIDDNNKLFIELHAQPESFFYIGSYRIYHKPMVYSLTFDVAFADK